MRYRSDGSYQSSNTPTYQNVGQLNEDGSLYRCMVTRVSYVDDPLNFTKNSQNPEVLYDVIVLGGLKSGQLITNCKLTSYLGGNNSYSERVLRPASKDLTATRLSDQDGDICYVMFNQSNDGFPVIMALGKGINDGVSGTKSSDGPRIKEEYNGVNQEINNKGEYIITRKGGSVQSGAFVPNSTVDNQIKMVDGNIIIKDSNSSIDVDANAKKVTITSGATKVIIDSVTGKVTLSADFIDLGNAVNDLVVMFMQLATAYNAHSHTFPYFAGPAPAAGVTAPPIGPLLQTVGSQTVKVQP